jgi:uric acid transporter
MSAPVSTVPKKRVHPVDEILPIPKLATYGFQHVVAFYAGAVLVPILIASAIDLPSEDLVKLITADLFTCGIASIIQAVGFWKIGVRLPLLQGVTFAGVSPIIAIGLAHGGGAPSLLYVYGAVIVAGIFTFLIAPIFIKLLRFFPPVVTGTLITITGLCLVPVGAHDAVTNPHTGEVDPTNLRWLLYALGTIAIIVAIQRVFRGFLATSATCCAPTAWPPPSAASSTRSPTPRSPRTSGWSASPASRADGSSPPPASS